MNCRKEFQNVKKIELVGEGEYGCIYKVDCNGKIYACKLFHVDFDSYSTKGQIKILKVIDSYLSFNFPSVLHLYELGYFNLVGEKEFGIITEYCEHGYLENCFKELNNTQKLINFIGIAAGLNYLNELHIIHRDISLSSIVLDEHYYPRICNVMFKNVFTDLEKIAKVISTSIFTAPETFEKNEYTTKSEVYGFGMLVYILLTGNLPYQGLNGYKRMLKIINDETPELTDDIKPCYQELIKSCWEHDSSKRPSFLVIVANLICNEDFKEDVENKEEVINYIEMITNSSEIK